MEIFKIALKRGGCLTHSASPVTHLHRLNLYNRENISVNIYSHLSISADLDLLVVIPWVEDVLGAVKRKTLLVDPLHTENPS